MSQQQLELPKGWIIKKISELTKSYSGGTPSTSVKDYWNSNDVPWIKSGEIKDNIIKESQSFISKKGYENSSAKLYPKETVLVAITGATTGKTAYLLTGACGTQNVFGILPCESIFQKYLWYFMRNYYSKILAKVIGTAQKHVNGTIIKNTPIPLPPLNEQKRIVTKIEELFSKIDSTKQSLEHTKLQLEQYRYSLLKYLFEGKEWKKIKIGDHLNFQYGKGLPKKDRKQGKIPVYGSSGIDGYHNEALVKTPSLIIGRKGTAGHVQFADHPFWAIDTTYFIEETKIYNLKFLYHLLIHLRLGSLDSSTAVPSLRRDDAYALEIPLPSIEEQEQIVSQIEQSFSLTENSQNIVNSTLQTLETMRMSVLKQAFQGKLVPQDPNDEPASILLEKIKKSQVDLKPKLGRAKNVK